MSDHRAKSTYVPTRGETTWAVTRVIDLCWGKPYNGAQWHVLLHITDQTKKAEDGLRKGEESMPDAPRLIRLLDPTAKARQDTTPLAPRPPDLRGRRIGILDNTKPNADVLMLRLATLLCQQHGAAEIMHRRKAHAAIGATDELCEDIVLGCDVVLVGSGDWGSCTSWSVHDAVQIETRGVPTVLLCTDEFSQLGRHEAESLGMPALPIALVPHPLGGQQPEHIREKAEKAVAQVIRMLTTPAPQLMQQLLDQA